MIVVSVQIDAKQMDDLAMTTQITYQIAALRSSTVFLDIDKSLSFDTDAIMLQFQF